MLNTEALLPFILALGVVMVAAPGTPGGCDVGTGTDQLFGLSDVVTALMIALYVAQDLVSLAMSPAMGRSHSG